MNGLVAELTKATPSHRSVVGPRFSGKSVILKHLAKVMRAETSPYCCVIEWDLRHGTPQTNQDFLKQLCLKLSDGLNVAGLTDYGKHLREVSDGHYGEICEVLDCLENEEKVLMVWDGFDKPLCSGKLTRNLWDNLLELCRKPSFRLVTATRRELSSLIRDEESVTSDFWGVFGDVVRIGPFLQGDRDAVLESLKGYSFQDGTKTELKNWTGGNPPLLFSLLNYLVSTHKPGPVSNRDINDAAAVVSELVTPFIGDLWTDCSQKAKDLYENLVALHTLQLNEAGSVRKELIEKGFATVSGQRITHTCRFLENYIREAGSDSNSMARMFGDWDAYKLNVRSFLERRLSHLECFDERLFRLVLRAIEDIPGFPDDCLNNLTGIRDRALSIIWQRELGASKELTSEVSAYWSASPRASERLIKEMMDKDNWHVPSDPSLQLRTLQYLTGSFQNFSPKAITTSKDTYVLLNAIHSYRNRNQHADGQQMHIGVAVAAMMTCIELLACLDRDKPSPQ